MSPSPSAEPPSALKMSPITRVSVTRGTFFSRTLSRVRMAAAISGSAAFLDPLTQMLPASSRPPVIFRR